MPWGAKTAISTAVSVQGTARQDPSTVFQVAPNEVIDIHIHADFPTTPVDRLYIYIEKTLDDATEQWTTEPPIVLPFTPDPNVLSISLGGVTAPYRARLQYAMSGATDTVTVNASYRLWTP